MTKEAALFSFFSKFLTSYPKTSVPEGATFPYLTYDVVDNSFYEGEANLIVNLWYRTTSESLPNAKVREISETIGSGGHLIECDDGHIWIKKGNPFCQHLSDISDTYIKQRYISLIIEFFTKN